MLLCICDTNFFSSEIEYGTKVIFSTLALIYRKYVIYCYWYLKILESAQLLPCSQLDKEDSEIHQPISAYGSCSCTWILETLVQFWGRNRSRQKFPFLSYTAMLQSHHKPHKQHLIIQKKKKKVHLEHLLAKYGGNKRKSSILWRG